ncbi:MAG: citrate lyase ACP [Candidatus Aegiribacteria sp.]|nr:citrate lyase ACP [Candidatus Aegiribacteria sp.]
MPEKALCGYSGPKVKSDCRISYENTDTELLITVNTEGSKEILEKAVRDTAARMGISRGMVEIDDCGAAPFVAAARFEAAVRKVLGNSFPPLPPAGNIEPSGRNIPRRSRLYVPGNRPRFMEKAMSAGADGVILDLEDSVSPDRKFEARIMVAHALANLDFCGMEVMVRINQGEYAIDDLDWIVPQPVQHILIPKVEIPDQVSIIRDMVEKVSELCGREAGVWLMPIIESPLGVFNALDIARSVPDESAALTLGLQDLSAEIGVTPTAEGTESFTARSLIVLAARAAGLQPIDTVYADVKNEDGLRESIRRAKVLGFVGKGCIHPGQVPIINEGFLPGNAALDKAKRIVLAMEQAVSEGLGAVALGSKMIDPPVAKQAQVVMDNAIRLGLISINWREEEKE